jgi:hypothetical protein
MRAAGGLLLAVGSLVVLARRGGPHRWTDFELFLAVAAPAALLFAIAVAGRRPLSRNAPEPWRGVLLVSAVLLSPVALLLFLQWAGASPKHLLYDAAVLAITATIAIVAGRRVGAPYASFLAGLALLGSWMLVWLKIVHEPSGDTVRWLLLAGGVLLLIAAAAMSLLGTAGATELATAGGLGAVAAGFVGVLVGLFAVAFGPLLAVEGQSSSAETIVTANGKVTHVEHIAPRHDHHGILGGFGSTHISGTQTTGWDVYLLLVSIGLVWLGARSRARGPAYAGALGLLIFLYSIATQLTRLESGHGPSSSLLGWPLILVLLGLAGLAAPPLARLRSG